LNDAFGRPQSVVVLGGTSDIARSLVQRLAAGRCRSVVLAGRDTSRLEQTAAELAPSIERTATVTFDAADPDAAGSAVRVVRQCFESAGEEVDLVVVAVGELGHQDEDEADPARVARMLTVNTTWPAAAMTEAAQLLREQGHGRILVLSSVAGYRVRRSNFVYGAAKAGLDGFAQGLGEAVRGSGVSVHVVRPGFVRTKMTEGRPAAPFAVGPERVAEDALRGLERGQRVIWSPGVLRTVFGLLGLLPAALWRKLPG
jgi:decaprenylphospho-beta-D-erythro-pentofuranosid-2-ulose 2-reductase